MVEKSPKFVFLDFEFLLRPKNQILICCVVKLEEKNLRFWLWHDPIQKAALAATLSSLNALGYTFVCLSNAEPRCFYSLGLDPLRFKWLDTQIMGYPFKHSSFEFNNFAIGNFEPDWNVWWDDAPTKKVEEEANASVRSKAASLLGFYQFFCDGAVDALAAEKKAVISSIIKLHPDQEIEDESKERILTYCSSDVDILEAVFHGQIKKWQTQISEPVEDLIKRYTDFTKFRVQMTDVSYHGMPLNREAYEKYITTYEDRIREEQSKMLDFFRFEPATYYRFGKRKGELRKPEKYTQEYKKF